VATLQAGPAAPARGRSTAVRTGRTLRRRSPGCRSSWTGP